MQQPHRPGPLHQTNKPHKGSRHNKSSATSEVRTKLISKPTTKLSRNVRINRATQNRKLKREQAIQEKRKLGSDGHPPILVGVLAQNLNQCSTFLEGMSQVNDDEALSVKTINNRAVYVVASRLKMRFKLIALDLTNFDESLDIVKTLDLLMILHKPIENEDYDDDSLIEFQRVVRMHCLPAVVHVVDGLSNQTGDARNITRSKKCLKYQIGEEKLHCVEKTQDYLQLFHVIGNYKRQRSQFKEARPIVATDHVEVMDGCLTFLGFVRKKTLSPNDLIHLVGFDDYQIKKIEILPDVVSIKPTSITGNHVVETLLPDPMKQETLELENELDPMEGEQTWPTAEELATEAERRNSRRIIKKLPPGTSAYQGAWIPESDEDDNDDVNDVLEDEEENMPVEEEDDSSDDQSLHDCDVDENIQAQDGDTVSLMDVDEYDKKNSNEKEMKILEKLKEARMNEMFPDEIDTPFDIPARFRFARYRGLKSFRTSAWDSQENLPPDYSKIFQFQNFQQTKRRVLDDEATVGANPGQYVRVYLANVSDNVIQSIIKKSVSPNLVGLLKYERKMTVMNLLIKRVHGGNMKHPIKSKDELIFYVGHRRFKAQPLFSNHSISSKFKYERFLRDDVAMVATIYAPTTFPPAPVLVFKAKTNGTKELVASGSVMDSNPNRMIIKRIRISGHPFKIHSKTAVIRFMFFNSEDVLYFKPVELITKYSRRGHITEPLGTHGHMKCIFDKKIRSDDCVFMNLYKRVFPKWTYESICDP